MEPLAPLGEQDDDNDESGQPEYYAGLNDKERRFVEEYVKDCNKTQAAIRAGYSSNPVSAATIGLRKYRKVQIRAAIDALLEEETLTTKQILRKLTLKAESSIEPFVESVGRTLKMDFDTPQAIASLHMIKKYKAGRYGPEIELHDPIKAMLSIEQIRNKVGKPGDDENENDELVKVVVSLPNNGRSGKANPPTATPAE